MDRNFLVTSPLVQLWAGLVSRHLQLAKGAKGIWVWWKEYGVDYVLIYNVKSCSDHALTSCLKQVLLVKLSIDSGKDDSYLILLDSTNITVYMHVLC